MNYRGMKFLFELVDRSLLCSVIAFLLLYAFAPEVAFNVFELIDKNFLTLVIVITIRIILSQFLKLLFKYLERRKTW